MLETADLASRPLSYHYCKKAKTVWGVTCIEIGSSSRSQQKSIPFLEWQAYSFLVPLRHEAMIMRTVPAGTPLVCKICRISGKLSSYLDLFRFGCEMLQDLFGTQLRSICLPGRLKSFGNHTCVFQHGTTTTLSASSISILFKILKIMLKGEKIYVKKRDLKKSVCAPHYL